MIKFIRPHKVYGKKYSVGDVGENFPRIYQRILVQRGIAEDVKPQKPGKSKPDNTWNKPQIQTWLEDNGADITGTKAELLERVNELHNGHTV